MIAVRRQITSSQLPARGLLFREVRYGLEEELETFIHKKNKSQTVCYTAAHPFAQHQCHFLIN